MQGFILNTGLFFCFAIAITLFKLLRPKESYELKTSLVLGISAVLIFTLTFLVSILINKWMAFWSIFYCLIFCFYLYRGSKYVAIKTMTGVFSRVSNELVGKINSGIGWIDPIYEKSTTNINGIENESIDLQELEIEIHETPLMHTATRGIQAKIKNIVFMLEIIENRIPELFEIEGGKETIKNRIISYINFFFLDEIGKILPTELDEDKGDLLKNLSDRLRDSVNKFCGDNHYPFEIPHNSTVTIGDTELEAEYYINLAKKEFARLQQDALDVEAERIRKRLIDLGNSLLPEGSENEKIRSAMIALKITPKTIEEKTFGVSPEIGSLFIELAKILKK